MAKTVNRPSQSHMQYINVKNRRTGKVERKVNVAYKPSAARTSSRKDGSAQGARKPVVPPKLRGVSKMTDDDAEALMLSNPVEFEMETDSGIFARQGDIAYHIDYDEGMVREYTRGDGDELPTATSIPQSVYTYSADPNDANDLVSEVQRKIISDTYGDKLKSTTLSYESNLLHPDIPGADVSDYEFDESDSYYPRFVDGEEPEITDIHDQKSFTIAALGIDKDTEVPSSLIDKLNDIGFYDKGNWEFNNNGDGYRDGYGGFFFINRDGIYSIRRG